jgi:hypothetical protein
MEALVVTALAVAALLYVAGPLGQRRWPEASDGAVQFEEAAARKESALRTIVDLEEERAVGKLSDADYQSLRADYEAEAASAMDELHALSRVPEDDVLEAEIAAMRERMTCPDCGALRIPGETCVNCRSTS